MVNKRTDTGDQEMPPPLDESWWEAVLAEDRRKPARKEGKKDAHMIFDEDQVGEGENPILVDEIDWDYAFEVYELDQVIEMEVDGYNRGGLLVKGEGLQGFVPLSHLLDVRCDQEEELETCLQAYQDRTLRLKMIECEYESERIVFSERAALSEPGSRIELLSRLHSGECVKGKVTNITGFGIFVDLGGVEGLVHVSEISWGRVQHPSDVVSIGQVIDVFVIQVDQDRSRVALSTKRLKPNPWENAQDRYYPGQLTEAVVTSIVPFGAFARLEEGLDGLIHNSEMLKAAEETQEEIALEEGQEIQVRIINIDTSKQRIGLSLNLSE